MSRVRDPHKARLRFWQVQISTPPAKKGQYWGTACLGLLATDLAEALEEAERKVPGCRVWNCSHRGAIDNADFAAV